MGGLLTAPKVGECYAGGIVTRRQRTPQGQVRLLVNGQWITFEPSPPLDRFKPGDTIRLVNRHCWEWQRWPGGVTAKVVDVLDGGARLRISTPESERGGFYYGVDSENWELVETPAPPPAPPPPTLPLVISEPVENAHPTGTPETHAPQTPKQINPGGLRVGDWVRYRGSYQSLRVQCEHSRRDGVRVTAIDGDMATIKAPKWIYGYTVPIAALVLDRRGNVPPAPPGEV